MNIKKVLFIAVLAITNMLSCMEPPIRSKTLAVRYLDAARKGTWEEVESILREIDGQDSQTLFAQSTTTNDDGSQTYDDALQLAISGSQRSNSGGLSSQDAAKMNMIIKAMLKCDNKRGLKAIDAAAIRLLLIPNARVSLTKEWDTRQFLISLLYGRLVELEKATINELSKIDPWITYHEDQCEKYPNIAEFFDEKKKMELKRQNCVDEACRNYALINRILCNAGWAVEEREQREDTFAHRISRPTPNPVIAALNSGFTYINNFPMGAIAASSAICIAILLSRPSHT